MYGTRHGSRAFRGYLLTYEGVADMGWIVAILALSLVMVVMTIAELRHSVRASTIESPELTPEPQPIEVDGPPLTPEPAEASQEPHPEPAGESDIETEIRSMRSIISRLI